MSSRRKWRGFLKIGILKKENILGWESPTFIQPKNNGTLRFLSNARKLNQIFLRKPFIIQKIQDMLINIEGFMNTS